VKDTISTIHNTAHSIPAETIEQVLRTSGAFIEFIVGVVKAVTARADLTLEQRNLLFRTVVADIAGCMRPLGRMMNCTDGSAEVLPAQMREILEDGYDYYKPAPTLKAPDVAAQAELAKAMADLGIKPDEGGAYTVQAVTLRRMQEHSLQALQALSERAGFACASDPMRCEYRLIPALRAD
jgi:hypothetical protein